MLQTPQMRYKILLVIQFKVITYLEGATVNKYGFPMLKDIYKKLHIIPLPPSISI